MLQSGYWPMFCYGFTCVNVSLNALTCRPRGVSYNLAFFAVVFGPLRYLQRLVYGFSHSFVSPAVARVDIHIYICSYTIWVAYLKKKKNEINKSIHKYEIQNALSQPTANCSVLFVVFVALSAKRSRFGLHVWSSTL